MSLSLIAPPRSRAEGGATHDRKKRRRTGGARATQADAIWILAAAVIFIGFQGFALLAGGP